MGKGGCRGARSPRPSDGVQHLWRYTPSMMNTVSERAPQAPFVLTEQFPVERLARAQASHGSQQASTA